MSTTERPGRARARDGFQIGRLGRGTGEVIEFHAILDDDAGLAGIEAAQVFEDRL